MATHDDPRNKYRHNLEDLQASDEVADADKAAISEFLRSIDPENFTESFVNGDGQTETKSAGTLHTYAHNLKRLAVISDTPLTDIESAETFNQLMQDVADGSHPHPSVKSDGYSAGTLKGWQAAAVKFYQYHDGLDVDPARVVIAKQDSTHVDERDIYTAEDVRAMREACDNPRDRCLLELLLNTGQRVRVIQTLRVKDVEPGHGGQGVYWLNTDVDGLKGADRNGGKRPLLGANDAVRDWLQYHPKPEPDAALITKRPSHNRGTAGEAIAQSTIRRTLKKIADKAGVDKPPNPHNFRHYFVTVAKRKYGMDDSTIKHLIGHEAASTIMETTYSHLSDEDYLREAEESYGIREPEEMGLTPDICGTCGNDLETDAKACERCGSVFTPDAEAAKEQAEADMWDSKGEAETEDEEEAIDKLRALLDEHPELVAEL